MASCLAQLAVLFILNLLSVGDAKPFFGGLSRGWPFAEPLVQDEPYANEIWTHGSEEMAPESNPAVALASDLNGEQRTDIYEEPTDGDRSETRPAGQSEVIPEITQDVSVAHQADVSSPANIAADAMPLAEPPLDSAEDLEAAELDLIMKRMHAMCDGLAAKPAHLRHGLVVDLCKSICVD